jgi:LemA protein
MIWIVVAIIAAIIIYCVIAYNGLIRRRNQIENAWSQVDVQLKRRIDLIPNLVEAVKGYAAHEKDTLDAVVKARNAAIAAPQTPAGQAAADNQITGALRQLFALSEAYPDLKANQNIMQVQEELTSTENKIAFARQAYNDTVMEYNTQREVFPNTIFAGMFGFQVATLLEATESADERKAPKVSFK